MTALKINHRLTHIFYPIHRLRDANILPVILNIDGHESCQDFIAHRAAWHKSCYLKFSDSRVKRKREHGSEGDRVKRQALDAGKCLFCGKD